MKTRHFFWLLKRSLVGAFDDNCLSIAKGVAFSAILSFFPLLLVVAALLFSQKAEAVVREPVLFFDAEEFEATVFFVPVPVFFALVDVEAVFRVEEDGLLEEVVVFRVEEELLVAETVVIFGGAASSS